MVLFLNSPQLMSLGSSEIIKLVCTIPKGGSGQHHRSDRYPRRNNKNLPGNRYFKFPIKQPIFINNYLLAAIVGEVGNAM
jgi:hypothetical protein